MKEEVATWYKENMERKAAEKALLQRLTASVGHNVTSFYHFSNTESLIPYDTQGYEFRLGIFHKLSFFTSRVGDKEGYIPVRRLRDLDAARKFGEALEKEGFGVTIKKSFGNYQKIIL